MMIWMNVKEFPFCADDLDQQLLATHYMFYTETFPVKTRMENKIGRIIASITSMTMNVSSIP